MARRFFRSSIQELEALFKENNNFVGDPVQITAQGREVETVILVLGAPHPTQTGARGWAGGRPNLLNVAVTRAKEVIYVVGNRQLWREAGLFRELDRQLPRSKFT